jgi:hypothetical protein
MPVGFQGVVWRAQGRRMRQEGSAGTASAPFCDTPRREHKLEPQRHHGVKSNLGGRMLGRVGGKEAKCAYRTER